MTPDSGPSVGGVLLVVQGANFDAGATVEVGGAPAPGVTVLDPTQIAARMPALAAGTLNDVVVRNSTGASTRRPGMWFSDFLDVPPGDPFQPAIEKAFRAAVASGCGGGLFCLSTPVTRAQAAKMLLRAKHGASYLPPAAAGNVFADVAAGAPLAAWIEELRAEGIASGCGGGKFCPDARINRASLAVLLLKTRKGTAYRPPAASGEFLDVPSGDPYAGWIEELAREGITVGCGGGRFCPSGIASRGELAVFLVRGFDLH